MANGKASSKVHPGPCLQGDTQNPCSLGTGSLGWVDDCGSSTQAELVHETQISKANLYAKMQEASLYLRQSTAHKRQPKRPSSLLVTSSCLFFRKPGYTMEPPHSLYSTAHSGPNNIVGSAVTTVFMKRCVWGEGVRGCSNSCCFHLLMCGILLNSCYCNTNIAAGDSCQVQA